MQKKRNTFYFLLCFFTSIFLLASCGSTNAAQSQKGTASSSTSTTPPAPTSETKASSTPKGNSNLTACPADGQARVAEMPGIYYFAPGKPHVIFFTNSGTEQAPKTAEIKSYGVQTKAANTIITLPSTWIKNAQLSADGKWILLTVTTSIHNSSRSALQVVRIDGDYLQTLYCARTGERVQNLTFSGSSSTQWSPDQQYITFAGGPDIGAPPLYLLTLKSGKLEILLKSASPTTLGYVPRTWMDNTRIVLTGMRPNGDGPPANLYLIDIKNGVNQPEQKLQRILSTSEHCWDFDSSYDASQLFVNHCQQNGEPGVRVLGSGRIDLLPPTGGQPKTIFTSSKHAITHVRTISNNSNKDKADTLLFSTYNTVMGPYPDHSQDGLWTVRTDGSQLQRLTSYPNVALNYFGQYPWSNVSRDGKYYTVASLVSPAGESISFGSLSGGSLTPIVTRSGSIAEIYLVGWTMI